MDRSEKAPARTSVLRPAYAWDCDECGHENFARGIVPDFSDEDFAEMLNEHGIQPWEAGAFVQMPETVKCAFCGTEFTAIHIKDDLQES